MAYQAFAESCAGPPRSFCADQRQGFAARRQKDKSGSARRREIRRRGRAPGQSLEGGPKATWAASRFATPPLASPSQRRSLCTDAIGGMFGESLDLLVHDLYMRQGLTSGMAIRAHRST
jgi:hypothetical protein